MLIKENQIRNIITNTINELVIKSEIDNIINEELGISSQVLSTSDNILYKIQNLLPDLESEKIEEGVFLKKGYIEEYILDNKLSISFTVYNFLNKEFFEKNKEKYKYDIASSDSSFEKRVSFLWINAYSISGQISKKSAIENIQHEIEHIFQQKNANKNLPSQEFYGIVRSNLKSMDKIEQAVAISLYYAYHFESDAFANGLYGYIKNEPYPIEWEDIKNSAAYEALSNSKKMLSFLKLQKEEDIKHYLSKYKLSYNEFFNRIIEGQNYFLHKIGKILSLHKRNLNTTLSLNEKNIRIY